MRGSLEKKIAKIAINAKIARIEEPIQFFAVRGLNGLAKKSSNQFKVGFKLV
jgi:hypothetical protein